MYELEKWVWSQHDFDLMGWHDATVHAFALVPEQFELLLDIGYGQYFRRAPSRIKEQALEHSQRGGLSFDRIEASA